MLAEVTGARRAIAVVNGTAALHACFRLAGVKPGDEVISPALTFIATANAIAYCGASPHFVDSAFKTLGIDAQALGARLDAIARAGRRRHHQPRDRPPDRGDRADAHVRPSRGHGRDRRNRAALGHCRSSRMPPSRSARPTRAMHVGSQARLAALSFNGNKIVTTGGGGAILTNDEALGRRAKHLTTTAKLPHKWAFVHDEVGFNYRLPNLNAALGCAQLEQLDGFLASKRRLARAL